MAAAPRITSYIPGHNYAHHWGSQLFENSNDFEVIARLNNAAGLKKLQDDANANADPAVPVRYSIWAPDCSDATAREAVRTHLDGGVLAKLAAKQVVNFINPMKTADTTFGGWTSVLLAACAMSLGCVTFDSLPGHKMFFGASNSYMEFVAAAVPFAYLEKDAIAQFKLALTDFESGVPYDFGSTTKLQDRMFKLAMGYTSAQATPCMCRYVGGLPEFRICSRLPKGEYEMIVKGEHKIIAEIQPCIKYYLGYVDGQCGSCGEKGAKLQCGRCKDEVYCNAACQKQDWKRHKTCCRHLEDQKYMHGGLPWLVNYFIKDADDESTAFLKEYLNRYQKSIEGIAVMDGFSGCEF